jgi:hypothetical protein
MEGRGKFVYLFIFNSNFCVGCNRRAVWGALIVLQRSGTGIVGLNPGMDQGVDKCPRFLSVLLVALCG